MSDQVFGPRRCRDARKPELNQCSGVAFYQCMECKTVYYHISREPDPKERDISCCGHPACRLRANQINAVKEKCQDLKLDYQIIGGYNDNSVKVSFSLKRPELRPEWIFLKTYTGGCMKYVADNKRPYVVFSLADTDAFAYCDADPCLECTFRCKRGFVLYAYFKEMGLIGLPLDQMSPYWQSEKPDSA